MPNCVNHAIEIYVLFVVDGAESQLKSVGKN